MHTNQTTITRGNEALYVQSISDHLRSVGLSLVALVLFVGGNVVNQVKHPYLFKNMVGLRFGRLQVLEESGSTKNGHVIWLCKCDCGKTKRIDGQSLRKGATKSCGCLARENNALRLPNNEGIFRALYRSRKRDAERRGYTFELSTDEFRELIHKNCIYCGDEPKQVFRVSSRPNVVYIYNGIDRIDSSKGYSTGNCHPCCGVCNTMKGKLPFNKFVDQVVKIAKARRSYGGA